MPGEQGALTLSPDGRMLRRIYGERDLLGALQRQRLRRELADDSVERRDDEERDDERDAVRRDARALAEEREQRRHQIRDGGLAHPAERAEGREHEASVAHGVDRILGALAERQQTAQYERQQAMLAKEEAFIARFKARASHAAQVQSRVKKLDKIDPPADAGDVEQFAQDVAAVYTDTKERLADINPPEDAANDFSDFQDVIDDQIKAIGDLEDAGKDEPEAKRPAPKPAN